MSKIKFKLVKFEKAIAFQIMELEESLRKKEAPTINFVAKNCFLISSGNHSLLTKGIIYIQHIYKEDDNCILTRTFENNAERDVYHDKILEALKDWAENWEWWREDKSCISCEKNIYEF